MRTGPPVAVVLAVFASTCTASVSTTTEDVPTTSTASTPTTTESTVATTSTTLVEPAAFKRLTSGSESALAPATGTSFEGDLNGVGPVVEHDGIFHMLYNDIQGGWPPTRIAVGYATSTDGISWERATSQPLLSADELPYPGVHVFASGLVIEDDTWILYFHVVADEAATGEGDSIGVATAAGPEGPWTVHPELLLEPDPNGWDSFALWAPNVVRSGEGFHMYYTGIGELPNPEISVGLATSRDGFVWTRHPDPVLSKGVEGAWDERKAEQGQVVRVADRWYMLYRTDSSSGTFGGQGSALGLATSSDGIAWERPLVSPVMMPGNGEPWTALWSVGVVPGGETVRIVMEAEGPYPGTRWFPAELDLSQISD